MMKIAFILSLIFVGINCDNCGYSYSSGSSVVSFNYVNQTSTTYIFQLTFNNTNPTINDATSKAVDVHAFPLEYNSYFSPSHFDIGTINGGAFYVGKISVPKSSEVTSAISGSGSCVTWGFHFYNAKTASNTFFSADLRFSTSNPVLDNKRSVEEEEEVHSIGARSTCADTVSIASGTSFGGVPGGQYWNSAALNLGTVAATALYINVAEQSSTLTTTYSGAHSWSAAAANSQKSTSFTFDCQFNYTYYATVSWGWTCGGKAYTNSKTEAIVCGTGIPPSGRSIEQSVVNTDAVAFGQRDHTTIRADYAIAIASAGVAVAAVAIIAAVVVVRRRKVEQSV